MNSLAPIVVALAAAAAGNAQTAENGNFMGGDTNLTRANALSDRDRGRPQ